MTHKNSLMESLPKNRRWYFVRRYYWQLGWALSKDNGFYNFQLDTPLLNSAKAAFKKRLQSYIDGELSAEDTKKYIHAYYRILYKETLRDFKYRSALIAEAAIARKVEFEGRYIPPQDTVFIHKPDIPEPEFINGRFEKWESDEFDQSNWQLDNHFPEQDYSHIPVGNFINSVNSILRFGKKHRDKTIREILIEDVQYLQWLVEQDTRVTFTDTMKQLIVNHKQGEANWD